MNWLVLRWAGFKGESVSAASQDSLHGGFLSRLIARSLTSRLPLRWLHHTASIRTWAVAFSMFAGIAQASASPMIFLDQGSQWTAIARSRFYTQDQGSQLIPSAWLKALRQPDGTPFLAGSLARYGYLPNDNPTNPSGLPVGFTSAPTSTGPVVGMTCSACHTRQIDVDEKSYRIDGAPAMADFGAFVVDLDAAVRRVLADDQAFDDFAGAVLQTSASEPSQRSALRAEVATWSTRFHALVAGALPQDRPWGPTRLDAIGMIYNFLGGLDVGVAPTYLVAANIQRADAPTRYPFIWNAARQDLTQWTGVARNGTPVLALSRNLSEIYGVFGTFHPHVVTASATGLDRDYLAGNSTSFDGFKALESLVEKIGPPVWPWPVDPALAKQGEAIFDRPTAAGGCADCHGEKPSLSPTSAGLWKTPVLDVGTDTRAWHVLLRSIGTGSLKGASIPGAAPPLRKTDLALNLLQVAVMGTIVDHFAATNKQMPRVQAMHGAVKKQSADQGDHAQPLSNLGAYESRVLHGVWAAAPYLHNGSVPTLADLLEPAADRPQRFEIGPIYDTAKVGFAPNQAKPAFTLETTGCDQRNSGASNCGHEYGTRLPASEKKALLEYLKTL